MPRRTPEPEPPTHTQLTSGIPAPETRVSSKLLVRITEVHSPLENVTQRASFSSILRPEVWAT